MLSLFLGSPSLYPRDINKYILLLSLLSRKKRSELSRSMLALLCSLQQFLSLLLKETFTSTSARKTIGRRFCLESMCTYFVQNWPHQGLRSRKMLERCFYNEGKWRFWTACVLRPSSCTTGEHHNHSIVRNTQMLVAWICWIMLTITTVSINSVAEGNYLEK